MQWCCEDKIDVVNCLDDGGGSKNVTQGGNPRCFALHLCHSISFDLGNKRFSGVEFSVCEKKKEKEKENIVLWRFYVLHKKWNLKFHIILVQERQRNTRKGPCLIYYKATALMMYSLLPPFWLPKFPSIFTWLYTCSMNISTPLLRHFTWIFNVFW